MRLTQTPLQTNRWFHPQRERAGRIFTSSALTRSINRPRGREAVARGNCLGGTFGGNLWVWSDGSISHHSYPENGRRSSPRTFGSLLVVHPDSFLYLRVCEMTSARLAPQIFRKAVQFLATHAANCEWAASLFGGLFSLAISSPSVHEPGAN